ncbi:hypothetical protein NQ317_001398 [Molorchus minor]|uniref:Uncharacterized protein n=1 Tax=Molorchus minor TaxID=1323400 RepID=A0ABQ9J5G1_9CUCU|nr:hypothetical protein NQ317_001398 [Molorchus minor]
MDKKPLKELLELCKKAGFREVYSSLNSSYGKIDNKCAISLIVGCCNACVSNMSSPEKVSEEDLYVLLDYLTSFIIELNETEMLSYLQSIFFILKLFVKKKCYTTIAKSEKIVVPRFLGKILIKKHIDTYQSSANLLCTLVSKTCTEKEIKCSELLLKICFLASTIYVPSESIDKSSDNINECLSALKSLKNPLTRQLIENKLNPLLYTVVISYYKSTDCQKWFSFSEECQLVIFELIYGLGKLEAESKFTCQCKCPIKRNIYQSFMYSQHICALIELSVNGPNKTSITYHEKSLKLIGKFCENIRILKENNCEKWKNAWNLIGLSIYNIGVHLYQKTNDACLPYFYMLIKHFIQFENKHGVGLLKFSMITSSFTVICALNAKDYKKCMAFSALGILLCPDQRETIIGNWIKAKVSQRDAKTSEGEDVQKITLASAFTKFKPDIFNIIDDEEFLSDAEKVELLIVELEQYKKRWKSKIPMMAALKELCDVADLNTSVKVIVHIFGDCEMNLHDDVPRILHRTLKLYEKENLNKSLNIFSSVITEEFTGCFENVSNSMLYDLLLKISYEFRLHRHSVRNLQALQTALKVAQADNNPCHILKCVAFIIENSDIGKSYVKNLIKFGDDIIEKNKAKGSTDIEVLLTYYVCKAKAYLYHDYKEAYRIYEMVNDLYESMVEKDGFELVKSQLLILHYKFVMMPCSYRIVDHEKSTLLTIHNANAIVFEAYNKMKTGNAYELSILLEANDELAKLYYNLRCPREVRAYCRETVILAQKLVLPLRCATYLVYLAHADLKSTRYDDCQVKLNGLADILCLTKRDMQAPEETGPPKFTNMEKEVEAVTNEMQEMVLDLPVPNHYKRQFSPSSPTLVIQPFHLPSFLSHNTNCDCFCCICFEYQELVLEKIRLDAFINVKRGNPKVARDFFVGALDLYDWYIRRYKAYRDSVSKFLAADLVPVFEKEFLVAFGSVLLNYSAHLMRDNHKSEAMNLTDKLICLLMPRKAELPNLYSEALVQKLGYLTDIPEITVESDKVQLEVDESADLARTPESKHSRVVIPPQLSPTLTAPKRIQKKCLKFNLSPDNDEVSDERRKKSPKRVPKTPAPKIEIYDDLSLKTKTPLPKVQIFTDTKKSARKKGPNINDAFLASDGAEACTPTVSMPSKNEGVLKSRTKLLTEKLRQSSRKTEKMMRTAWRTSEWGGVEGGQSVGQGAIKRTTRQRKL